MKLNLRKTKLIEEGTQDRKNDPYDICGEGVMTTQYQLEQGLVG